MNPITYTGLALKPAFPMNIDITEIIQRVEYITGISYETMKGETKLREIVLARHIAMYLIRKFTKLTLVQIGAYFNRNHATVIYAVKKIEYEKEHYKDVQDILKKYDNPDPGWIEYAILNLCTAG